MIKKLFITNVILLVIGTFVFAEGNREFTPTPRNPDALELEAPIVRWDNAIPLGNGLTGILLWGKDNEIRLSLDRGDLWDNRLVKQYQAKDWNYQNMIDLVKAGKYEQLNARYDAPYEDFPYPTKLPGGRLVLRLPSHLQVVSFRVDFKSGIGYAYLDDGSQLEVIYCQNLPAAIVVSDVPIKGFDFMVPGQHREEEGAMSYSSFNSLGYPKAQLFRDESGSGFYQENLGGRDFMMAAKPYHVASKYCLVITMLSENEHNRGFEALKREHAQLANKIINVGNETYRNETLDWWKKFNSHSRVQLEDTGFLYHYNFTKYLYGAAARRGAPPMPLQGVWTADTAGLPPWKGDFHFDLNMQMNYWGVFMAGLEEAAGGFTDFMDNLLPAHKAIAKNFYGAENGIAIPGVMTLDGKPMGGWPQYSLSPIHGAWVAQHYYWQWKYSGDKQFLLKHAYPYMKGVANTLLALLKEDDQGYLKLPLSTSPEIFNNSEKSWLTPNSNYDLSLMKWLFSALEESATVLNNGSESKWADLLTHLEPLHVDNQNQLMFDAKYSHDQSHRHQSDLMSIYPLQLLDPQGEDQEVVLASLNRIKKLRGTYWVGYSFTWAACMEAIAGRADEALWYLSLFDYAYVTRNGFHVNGDQKKTGTSQFTYRPFTLEGNFAGMQAIHLMLLQNRGETISLFPAVPSSWSKLSFTQLRAYGGTKVSASYLNGVVNSLTIESTQKGKRVVDLSRLSASIREGLLKVGMLQKDSNGTDIAVIKMKAGEVLEF